jgi:4-hydroxythreonine-4-phosphate dehydrogenase
MSAKIGITIGDINGIGPEIIIKTLCEENLLKRITPIIYGSSKSIGYHKNIVQDSRFNYINIQHANEAKTGQINVITTWQDTVDINIGEATEISGQCAYIALDKALNDLKEKKIDALVTAPINKAAMKMADFPYLGHTEYITDVADGEMSLMLLTSDQLTVGLVTAHIPLEEVAEEITADVILDKLEILDQTLKVDFGLERPMIAVLGLNPHAGDSGQIGTAEETDIAPAILAAKENGIMAAGPFPADGFFGSGSYKKFDAILAMYHDQGLIPFKTLSFGTGVNFTAGLDIIRTSPDHGTAYEIAGKNLADPSSMRHAIYKAMDIVANRKLHDEVSSNSLDTVVEHKEEAD